MVKNLPQNEELEMVQVDKNPPQNQDMETLQVDENPPQNVEIPMVTSSPHWAIGFLAVW